MTLGNSVMQRRLARRIGSVERTVGLYQKLNHGHGTDGCGAVQGVLAALVFDACGGWWGGGEETACEVDVLF